jgi:cubilin
MCGGRKIVNSNEIGELTSPNYPHHSVTNPDCHWILMAAQPEEHITLTFTRLDIYESETCEHNFVEVRDGDSGGGLDLAASPLIGRYCGNRIPAPITSQGNALYITNAMGVFRATYATSTSYCGGEFTSESGYFMSPVCFSIVLLLK